MTDLPKITSHNGGTSSMHTYFHDEHRLDADYLNVDDRLVPRHFEFFYGNQPKAHFTVDVNGEIRFTWSEPDYTADTIRPFLASIRLYNSKLDLSHLPAHSAD